ncbi:MAG: FAD:protein FMN transferase [Candidatus Dormibacteraeota bacterium]|nr:FAD:protein FMN transferase [Candidatus Dormibacteraeota bacterium]
MPAEIEPAQRRFEALGTTCHLIGTGAAADRLAAGEAWVRAMHARLTRFEAGSELSRLNAAGHAVRVSAELEALLLAALEAWRESGGLVNAAVLPAMLASGYTRPLAQGPGRASGAPAVPPPLPAVLQVGPGRSAWVAAGAGLDLGGIAKGWMADRLALNLGGDCVVNLGGDLFARGSGPSGDGWPVAFGGATLLLRDQGAATSSIRRRRWRGPAGAQHHLIDPRTGRPSDSGVEEVAVVCGSALEAEVLAKTALLAGPREAEARLRPRALAWWLRPVSDAVAPAAA